MPFLDSVLKYLPLIQTGASIAGNYLGGRAQTNAIQNAGQINQQATDDAMRIILGLYDEGQSRLAPYQNVGPAALNNLQAMANRGRIPAPASVQPPPTGNAMSRFAPQSRLLSGGGAGGAVRNAMTTNAQGQPVNPMSQAAKTSARNSMLGSLAGAAALPIGGAILGSTIGSGLGMGGALGGASWALGGLGGPIGLGLGALGGLIGSQFGKNNPYKAAASRGIDEVSRQIWGTNTPGIPPEQLTTGIVADVLKGRKPVAAGKAEINDLLNSWEQGMRDNGTPADVIESSVRTQMGYLQPLRDIFARLEARPAA